MLSEYSRAAIRRATFEVFEDDVSFCGRIPALEGVWETAGNLEDCRTEFEQVLEEWLLLWLSEQPSIPEINALIWPCDKKWLDATGRPDQAARSSGLLRSLGYHGPFSGKRHQFMRRAERTVRLPNPHRGEISRGLLVRILREAGISRKQWESI